MFFPYLLIFHCSPLHPNNNTSSFCHLLFSSFKILSQILDLSHSILLFFSQTHVPNWVFFSIFLGWILLLSQAITLLFLLSLLCVCYYIIAVFRRRSLFVVSCRSFVAVVPLSSSSFHCRRTVMSVLLPSVLCGSRSSAKISISSAIGDVCYSWEMSRDK
jgi:hypothetical protein